MRKIVLALLVVFVVISTAGCLFSEEQLTVNEEYTLQRATENNPIVKKIQFRGVGHVGNSYIWDDGVNLYIKIVSLMPEWEIAKAAIYFTTPDNKFDLPRNGRLKSPYYGPYVVQPVSKTFEVFWVVPLSDLDTSYQYTIWWTAVDFLNRETRKRLYLGACGNKYYF